MQAHVEPQATSWRDRKIDWSRRFMPERLTPLFHTPVYGQLSTEQRLRYNQLHSCYLNEQTIFFESSMARHILGSLGSEKLPEKLAEGVKQFIVEEARHSQMFRELNRQCQPEVYSKCDHHFIQVSAVFRVGLNSWVKRANWFPFFLWILLIQEERALFYAKEFVNQADELESNFVSAQRRHLADEIGHIHWDEQLLEWVWPRTGRAWRSINARMFRWIMGEFFTTPKRSGLNVVAELIKEFPGLGPLWPELSQQMLKLSANEEFNRLCYSRDVTPKAFARFDGLPEFHGLGRVLPGYCTPSNNSGSRG